LNFETLHLSQSSNNQGSFNFSSIYLCESFWAYQLTGNFTSKGNYVCAWAPEANFNSYETNYGNTCNYTLNVQAPSVNFTLN